METTKEEKICACALNRLLGFEPKTAHALIAQTGSAWNVFNLTEREKMELLGPFSKLSPLLKDSEPRISENELEKLESEGCSFITMADDGYPELLKECEDAPIGLYFKSVSKPDEVFNRIPQIAVVGTRDISLYGKEWCRRIVGSMALARHKPLVVSGFAYGTDIIAHLAAAGVFLAVNAGILEKGPLAGWLVVAALLFYVASFSIGPGVVVWLALSELMPNRIRANGMAIAMFINMMVAYFIADRMLALVERFGYAPVLIGFACATMVYFITAACFLPETKGKTLEEIEAWFSKK